MQKFNLKRFTKSRGRKLSKTLPTSSHSLAPSRSLSTKSSLSSPHFRTLLMNVCAFHYCLWLLFCSFSILVAFGTHLLWWLFILHVDDILGIQLCFLLQNTRYCSPRCCVTELSKRSRLYWHTGHEFWTSGPEDPVLSVFLSLKGV